MKNAFQTIMLMANMILLFTVTQAHAQKDAYGVPDVPSALKIDPKTDKLAFYLTATGFQVYDCKKDPSDPNGPNKWILREPVADLFNAQGKKVGTHGKGPVWRSILPNDASEVTGILVDGKPKGKTDSPSAGAIPWLLLDAKAQGKGLFAGVTKIQRLETNGGRAPEGCCDASGCCKEVRVPYTATYYFYVSK